MTVCAGLDCAVLCCAVDAPMYRAALVCLGAVLCYVALSGHVVSAKLADTITTVEDDKGFKKLLRSRTNVLVVAAKDGMHSCDWFGFCARVHSTINRLFPRSELRFSGKSVSKLEKTLNEVASATEGKAALVYVDCRSVQANLSNHFLVINDKTRACIVRRKERSCARSRTSALRHCN